MINKRPGLYIIARRDALTAHVQIYYIYNVLTPVLNSNPMFDKNSLTIWSAINIVPHLPFTFRYFRKHRANNEAPSGTTYCRCEAPIPKRRHLRKSATRIGEAFFFAATCRRSTLQPAPQRVAVCHSTQRA